VRKAPPLSVVSKLSHAARSSSGELGPRYIRPPFFWYWTIFFFLHHKLRLPLSHSSPLSACRPIPYGEWTLRVVATWEKSSSRPMSTAHGAHFQASWFSSLCVVVASDFSGPPDLIRSDSGLSLLRCLPFPP